MLIRRAYKFQLKATGQLDNQLRRFAGCVRLVWNMAWNIQKARLDQAEKVLTYGQMAGELVKWKKNCHS
jgi:putative transposase